jgi:5-methylcytosine-specific restriction endonuclease McrA
MIQYKTCSKCKQTLSLESYSRQSKSKDGLQFQCKTCKKIGNRETMKKWREKNPQLHRDRNKKSRDADKQRATAARARSYQKNKQKENQSSRLYYQRFPEKYREAASLRNRKKLVNGIFFVSASELKKLYSSTCALCASADSIEIDHIVPISKGGSHSIGNLQPLCRPCNRSKSDKFLIVVKMNRKSNE